MFILLALAATAAPIQLTHQGRLLDALGTPITGTHTLQVRLMSAETGGVQAWTDTFTGVAVDDGYYTVRLGSGAPLDTADLTAQAALWVEVVVDGTAVGPRTPLVEVPFAGVAREVRGPVVATSVVVNGKTVIDATGAVLGDGPTNITCPDGQTVVQSGTTWTCADNQRTDASVRTALSTGAADLHIDTRLDGQLLDRSLNIRTIVTKADADTYCGGATAIHVPWRYRGQTGDQICAADARGLTTCTGVLFVYVTNANGQGRYIADDLPCSAPVDYPWPWGEQYARPNTLSSEWAHGNTHVVCCQ